MEPHPIIVAFAFAGAALFVLALCLIPTIITDKNSKTAREVVWQTQRAITALLSIFLLVYFALKIIWAIATH